MCVFSLINILTVSLQVRVGNLQELVYKMGQAGVTKATVTLVFNNADVASSPVGYESSKQITVTRQV
jgi:structural maintenance of chromosome 2